MNEPTAASRRVFLAALAHETNTFSPLPTTLASFAAGILHRGGDASTFEKACQFPGYVDLLKVGRECGDKVVAGMCAWAQPGGLISRTDYEALRNSLLAELGEAGPVDFVFLVLHGAMVAEGYDDCEGDLLARVRAVVGDAVPIGALLDLHGNVTDAMVASGAILVACKEYPHTDYLPRTRELHTMLADAAEGRFAPHTTRRRVPMLGLFGTTEGPMKDFVRRLEASEQLPGIASVSAMHGFPWSDTVYTGASIIVVASSQDAEAVRIAEALADDLAKALFALRSSAAARRLPLAEAIDGALAARGQGGPVVMADSADNPGGGAACDSTFVLRALLARRVDNVALGMIWDPQAVQIASAAGVGARLPLRVGGKVGPLSGDPIDLDAEVIAVRDDAHQRGLDGKVRDPLGAAVAIRASGIDIVLNSIRQQPFSPDCFTEFGIDPAKKAIVVVKSTQHFRAAFDPIAKSTIYCDAPGSLNGDLAALPYRHLSRPMWPLDAIEALT